MRKTTSIKVDPVIWKKAKMKALNDDIDLGVYVEELIKKDLKIK